MSRFLSQLIREESGHPQPKNVGTLVPTESEWVPTETKDVGTRAPTVKNVATHNNTKRDFSKVVRNENKGSIHLRPDKAILKQIRVFCAENGIGLSEFYDAAASHYLANVGTHTPPAVGTLVPYDDRRLVIYKTDEGIINLYQTQTKNRWKLSDDREAHVFNDKDIKLIELGMLQTFGNKKYTGKINSFKYFIPEIEIWLENPMEPAAIDTILNIMRHKFLANTTLKGK